MLPDLDFEKKGFGLIKTVNINKSIPGSPRIICAGAEVFHEPSPTGYLGQPFSGGAGLSAKEAIISAIGELVERYAAGWYRKEDILIGSYQDLSKEKSVLTPSNFPLFSSSQYDNEKNPWEEFSLDALVGWTEMYNLKDGGLTLVPASQCYMPYFYSSDAIIAPSISTGLASHKTIEEAILSGIYECVERDAFTIFWMNQGNTKKFQFEGEDSSFNDYYNKYFRSNGYKYQIYDITTDIKIPSYLTVLYIDNEHGQIISIGASSNLNPFLAIKKSMKEAVQGGPYIISLIEENPFWRPNFDFSNVNDFSESAKLYSITPELQPYIQQLEERVIKRFSYDDVLKEYQSGSTVNNTSSEISSLISILTRNGFEVFAKDLTTADVNRLGYKVIRVFIPGLQMLHGDHRYPFLANKRLYNVPIKNGTLSDPREESFFKAVLPHPFP
jgi:ribosomal protein S12 methylthiotransferase accessory factor